jgi:hypothetical protein
MRNRAKCKLCDSIIESFHHTDYVECKCGHISVSEGDKMGCGAIDFINFLRVDDEGNEIIVKEVGKENKKQMVGEVDLEELIEELRRFSKSIERLPNQAMSQPINHFDFLSAIWVIIAIIEKIAKSPIKVKNGKKI